MSKTFDIWLQNRNETKDQIKTIMMNLPIHKACDVKIVRETINRVYSRNITPNEFHYIDFIGDFLVELSMKARMS